MSDGVKPVSQKRSKVTRDKLVQALEDSLRDRAFDQISVADIAAKASLSVGSVYRRFENKDAFIPVIFEIYMKRLQAFHSDPKTRIELDPKLGLRSNLRTIARSALTFLDQEAHIMRAAHLYARLRPDLVGDDWEELLEQSVSGFQQVLEMFSAEIQKPISREMSEVLTYLFNTIFVEKGLYPKDGPALVLSMRGDEFADEVADLVYGYLVLEPSS